jgi:recombination DNA repair RAD52 pathway protein
VSLDACRAFRVSNHTLLKENTMNREILERPFGPEQIKQREGNFGKMLDYIEGHAVIQRLNDAFDADWSFTIIRHDILKETDEVIVIGQLNAGGIVKSQFGSSRITRARETGDIISLSDDLKAAATDALKKAATLFGVGLHLYRNDRPQGHTVSRVKIVTPATAITAEMETTAATPMATVGPTGQRVTVAMDPADTRAMAGMAVVVTEAMATVATETAV